MAPFDRRDFSGNAVPTTTTGAIDNDDLTINIAVSTGWPDGDVGPFIVTIDRGLSTEEKVEVASRTGLVLTVTATGRGHDNTSASSHGPASPIEHTVAARDLAEANQHLSDDSLDNHSQYFNSTRHDAHAHSIATAEVENNAVTYEKLAAGQRWEPGDFKLGIQTADHEGWLLCDGRSVAIATYAGLWTAMGTAHMFAADPGGGNFKLPDLRKKMLMGKAAAGVGSTLGGSGGAADAVAITHLHTAGTHSHSADHDHTATSGAATHTHGTDAQGSHQHAINGSVNNYVSSAGSAIGLVATATNQAAYTAHDSAGSHSHNVTGDGSHSHTVTVNTKAVTTGTSAPSTNNAGVSGTDLNLPPFLAVNGFIHT